MASDPVDVAMSAAAGTYAPADTTDPVEAAMSRAAAPRIAEEPETLKDVESRHNVMDQEPMDVSALPHPWQSLGRMTAGAVTNLAGLIPFAGGGIAESIRKHTSSIQPQNVGEEIGAAGMDAALPLLTMGGLPKIKQKPQLSAQEIVNSQAAKSQTNMGAAAAAPNIAKASPDLQQAVVNAARQTGGAVNPEALARHAEADSLPVKMQLTAGQALQDPSAISEEINSRGKDKAMSDRMALQNKQLGDNLQAVRDKIGPDVFSTNQVEHGDTLIDAYKAKDAAAQEDINAKYKALRDANGSTMPLDTGTLIQNVDSQLKKQYLTDSVPPQAKSILDSLRSGEPMDFEGFEAARTRLAEAQRGGGSEAQAAKIIRNNLEQMPLTPEAAGLKSLADTARSAAKARFDALEADPAYDAAVHGTVPADKFTSKFVINAPRDDVATMKANLAGNDTATQTMGVAALDHLQSQANVAEGQSGNFASDKFNKALQALSPKALSLVDPQTAEQLSSLGKVARYVKGQPAGSYVNNSNTFVALAGEHAKNAAEHTTNAALMSHGIPIPGGSIIRKVVQNRAAAAASKKALEPGAGLTRLSDIAK